MPGVSNTDLLDQSMPMILFIRHISWGYVYLGQSSDGRRIVIFRFIRKSLNLRTGSFTGASEASQDGWNSQSQSRKEGAVSMVRGCSQRQGTLLICFAKVDEEPRHKDRLYAKLPLSIRPTGTNQGTYTCATVVIGFPLSRMGCQ